MPFRYGRPMAVAALLLAPSLAQAAPFSPGAVFANAAPFQKLLVLALIVATLIGVVIATRKLASGSRLAGGCAFVSGLRLGAPLIGLLGSSFAVLRMCMGVANVAYAPTLKALAPGLAEAVTLIGLGFLCGAVAVLLHWAIE